MTSIDPNALLSKAAALHQAGRMSEAEPLYRQVLAAVPNHPDALHLLGLLAFQCGHPSAAADLMSKAIQVNPRVAAFHSNLGIALANMGRADEGLASLRRAIALDPGFINARNNIAPMLARREQFAEAAEHYRVSLRSNPQQADIHAHYSLMCASICDWDHAEPAQADLRRMIGAGKVVPPFTMLAIGLSAAEQFACARTQAELISANMRGVRQQLNFSHRRAPRQKLKIGYLSSDYREHATTSLIAEMFELHDKERFDIVALACNPDDGSPIRQRIDAACSEVLDLTNLPAPQAAQRIHHSGVDILVDLKGYTADARPEIMALRPAPVQVAYLGYPGTMGAEFIDYALVDGVVAPPEAQPHWTEMLVRLPGSYQINDRRRPVPAAPARAMLGLPEDAFVFCSFNNPFKITRPMFEAWMRILAATPGGVLWMMAGTPDAEANLAGAAERFGIARERIIFAPRVGAGPHMNRLAAADLFLDTTPCNAHTTASDALWAGVPVLTLPGETFASRVAGSLLTAVGLPELIAADLSEYERLAVALAAEPGRVARLRERLVQARGSSALFDSPALTRAIERAYQAMWSLYVAGEKPQPIDIEPEA